MSEITYGQLASWDDANVSGGNDFMKLEQGPNIVRIFTNPFQFVVHWVKDSSGATRKIKCALNDCPLCKKGVKTQCRWYIGVIERKTQLPKVLEISSQILTGIKELVSDPEWGDVKTYDVNVKRRSPGSQPLYAVVPGKQNPLTAEEKAVAKDFMERVDIAKMTQPASPEEIMEKLGNSNTSQYSGGTKNVVTETKSTVTEDDFNFGDDDL